MELFTYLMAKNDHNTSVKKDLFSYLLGKNQSGTYQEYTGTSLSISNTKKGKMKIDLYGNTSQVSLSGKNLASLETTGTSIGGVSFTKENGVIHINGTTNSNASFNFNSFQTSSGTATYWIEVTGYTDKPSGNSSMVLQQSTDNSTWSTFKDLSLSSIYSKQDTVTLDSSKYYRIRWYTENNTFTNATIKVQLEMGSSKTSFEPYTGGTASPNPSYPQQIHTVTGDNTIKVCGKNLAYTGWASNFVSACNSPSIIYTTTKDNRNCLRYNPAAGYGEYDNKNFALGLTFKENTQYTVSYDILKETTNRNTVAFYYTDGTYTTNSNLNGTDIWEHQSITSTSGKTIAYIAPFYTSGETYIDIDTWQIEEGTTATTYEAYTSSSYPLTLGSIELNKIGTYQDYFYKDSGKWYKKEQVGKATDTSGSTGITINDMVSNGDIYSYYGGSVSGKTITYDSAISGTNTILYQKATATDTQITDTTLINQLEAVYNAKSYNEQTNINQVNDDLPFEMKVKVKVSS